MVGRLFTDKLLTADLINQEKLFSARFTRSYFGVRVGRFKLCVHRFYRGGCSFEYCKESYVNIDICSRKKHAWWAVMIYLYWNESLRSRA